MKKLIGISLVALLAIIGNNSAGAQVYTGSGYTTVVKNKGDGTQKVKVVPNPPPRAVVYPAPYRPVGVYHQAPYYGYRKVKYYDDYGHSHKMFYGEPYHHDHYHNHHYDDDYHYHYYP